MGDGADAGPPYHRVLPIWQWGRTHIAYVQGRLTQANQSWEGLTPWSLFCFVYALMADQWGGPAALEEALEAAEEERLAAEEDAKKQRKPRPAKLAARRLTREQAEAMAQGLDEHDSRIKGGRLVGG